MIMFRFRLIFITHDMKTKKRHCITSDRTEVNNIGDLNFDPVVIQSPCHPSFVSGFSVGIDFQCPTSILQFL